MAQGAGWVQLASTGSPCNASQKIGQEEPGRGAGRKGLVFHWCGQQACPEGVSGFQGTFEGRLKMDASHPSHSEGHPSHAIHLNSALKYPSKAAIIQSPWIYQPSIGFCLYYPMLPTLCLPVSYLVCLSAYNLSISCVYENIQDYKNLLQFWFHTISRHKP